MPLNASSRRQHKWENMNLEHLNEQREAARRDFLTLWKQKLEPRAISLGIVSEKGLAMIQDIAWQAFIAGLQKDKQP